MSTFLRFSLPSEPPENRPNSLATLHERIPIFMIEEKDVSTPCDERHANK